MSGMYAPDGAQARLTFPRPLACVSRPPIVLVVADATTSKGRDNARGHLFEGFVARLLSHSGYSTPTTQSLNVTSSGIELDVVATHELTGVQLIAECKAHSTNLQGKDLLTFYGKVSAERLVRQEKLTGLLVCIPDLVQPAREKAQRLREQDNAFLVWSSFDVHEQLVRHRLLVPIPELDFPNDDLIIIVAKEGLFCAVKELDPSSRLPVALHVFGEPPPSDQLLSLVRADPYVADIPVRAWRRGGKAPVLTGVPEQTLVQVTGSSSDFEYQLPASPRFFVGRRRLLQELCAVLDGACVRSATVVVNGQSGWGKSSLALRLKREVEARNGTAVVLDSRTASSPRFVHQALCLAARRAVEQHTLLLPEGASFASLRSGLDTLRQAEWSSRRSPLLLFFDQFETVFRNQELTREFRDLTVASGEMEVPLILGFAWKTDLVTWAEEHPYEYRDQIRKSAALFHLPPFGPKDIDRLLRRLEDKLGTKLVQQLKRRLREYSQGLPWLFKKLADHILREIRTGTSQDQLVVESLNVKRLFESDLAELSPTERGALLSIARVAPMRSADALEMISPSVVQSLLDRRLIVAIGDRLDTYWDTFRDFLNSNEIPLHDSFLLRQTPRAVCRLLNAAVGAGDGVSFEDAARQLRTTERVIMNQVLDLRLLGVLSWAPGRVDLVSELRNTGNLEHDIWERVSGTLRRSRPFREIQRRISLGGGSISSDDVGEILKDLFPAVEARPKTWRTYSRSLLHWLKYTDLALCTNGTITLTAEPAPQYSLVEAGAQGYRTRKPTFFPDCRATSGVQLAKALAGLGEEPRLGKAQRSKAIHDLLVLGILRHTGSQVLSFAAPELFGPDGDIQKKVLLDLLLELPGWREVVALTSGGSLPTADEIGACLRAARNAKWSASTAGYVGRRARTWLRLVVS